MCGILGLITSSCISSYQEKFSYSLELLSHRGPDYCDFIQERNILLGHTRLAIIDLNQHANQPMLFQDKSILIFNGEIYNYKEIKEELSLQGYVFHTQSDTEVLLCAYDFWGESCVEHLNGMWAFALLDKAKNQLFCSRDRFGEKPFFYYSDSKKVIFASEIKAILPFLDSISVNIPALIPFIVRGNIDCYKNETSFKNIYRLNPSENLIIQLDSLNLQRKFYYQIQQQSIQDSNPAKTLRILLEDSMKLRLRSDVPVGSCLSGGLDSSCINALMAKMLPDKKNFIAIHAKSSLTQSDESEYAKEVAKALDIQLCVIEPTQQEFLSALESVMQTQDEPFGSTSIYMQYFVMQKAKELGIKVMFDGQGADEVFLGYEHYFKYIYKDLKDRAIMNEDFFENLKSFRYPKEGILEGYHGIEKFGVAWERIRQTSGVRESYLNQKEIRDIFDYQSFFSFNIRELMQNNLQALLRFEDRDSMAFGVEARLPYLDYRIVEFVLSLPLEVKFQKGYLKYLLRESMQDLLPKSIIWRYNKMGFESPQELWIKDIKQEMLECVQRSRILKEIFCFSFLSSLSSSGGGGGILWLLFAIAKWEEIYKVGLE